MKGGRDQAAFDVAQPGPCFVSGSQELEGVIMRRFGILAMMAVALLLTGTLPAAGGGQPLLMERFDDTVVEDPDPLVLGLCGVEARTVVREKGSFILFGDESAKLHVNFEAVVSDPATGQTLLIVRNAFNVFMEAAVETIDEDERTRTVEFEETFTGLPLRWMAPGEGVLLRDAGTVTFAVTTVFDLDTGEPISFEEEITEVRGPHPFLELGEEEAVAIACGAVAG